MDTIHSSGDPLDKSFMQPSMEKFVEQQSQADNEVSNFALLINSVNIPRPLTLAGEDFAGGNTADHTRQQWVC